MDKPVAEGVQGFDHQVSLEGIQADHICFLTHRGGSLSGFPGARLFVLLRGLFSALLAEDLLHIVVHGVGNLSDLLQRGFERPSLLVGVAGRD